MDRRRQVRAKTVLPVKVWGVDANSHPFMQLATIRNISDVGIVLSGLRCPLKAGAVVDIQYNGSKAEFLVVWIGNAAGGCVGDVGMQRISSEPSIWDKYLVRASGLEAKG